MNDEDSEMTQEPRSFELGQNDRRGKLGQVIFISALTLGAAALAIWAFMDLMFSPILIQSPVSQVLYRMRLMATSLESYYVDNDQYPAVGSGAMGVHAFVTEDSPLYNVPTFRIIRAGEEIMTLTTPLPYLDEYERDRFAPYRRATFGYYTDPESKGWILFSPGPDGDYDLMHPELVYDPSIAQPSPTLIVGYAYDATNGPKSSGDIFRVKG